MARYYQSQLVKPISQYAPAPLKYIDEAGAYNQTNTDLQNAGLTEAQKLLDLQGGYRTQDRAKAIAEEFNVELNDISKELNTTGNVKGGVQRIKALQSRINNSPEVQDIRADQLYKEKEDAIRAEPGYNNYVQNHFNNQTGKYIQTKKGERFDPNNFYGVTKPGKPQEEFKPYYDQLHDVISQTYGPDLEQQVNPDGSISLIQNGLKIVGHISNEQLRNYADNLQEADPNFPTLGSFRYAKAVHDKQFGNTGSVWGSADNTDLFVNNYLNNKYEESQIQKVVRTVAPAKNSNNSNGGGDDDTENYSSEIGLVLNNILDRGESSAIPSTVAAIQNGVDNKDGTYQKNVSSEPPIIKTSFSKTNGNSPEFNEKLNKYIPIKANIENFKKKKINELENLKGTESVSGKLGPNGMYYYKDGSGNIHESAPESGYGDKNIVKTNRIISEDEYVRMQPEYQYTKKEAEKQGINIEDPKLESEVKNMSLNTLNTIKEFNISLSKLQGQVTFIPNASNNVTSDSENHLVTKDNIILSEEQAENLFDKHWYNDNIEKLKSLKLITEYTKSIKKTDGTFEEKTYYNIPVFNRSSNDLMNMTKSGEINRWGSEKFTSDQLDKKYSKNYETYQRLSAKSTINKLKSGFDDKQYTDKRMKEVEIALSNTYVYTKEASDAVRKHINEVVNRKVTTPEEVEQRKEELSQIYLKFTDPNKFNILYGSETKEPVNLGKPKAGEQK